MSNHQDKKTNYVNVNLQILKSIFANHAIPIVCGRKWAESLGIVSKDAKGNLIILSISILEGVFANEGFPILVSRKWLEGLHITIDVEAKPIEVQEAQFSIKPTSDFKIPKIENKEEKEEKSEEKPAPSGAVVFG